MIEQPFRLRTPDGEAIVGDVRIPSGPPPRSAVVLVHGFKGFKDWGFFPHLSRSIAAAGHGVVSFNFSRNGIGAEPLSFTELEAFARNTFTRELDELEFVLDALGRGDVIPRVPDRVGVLGHSRGGGIAVLGATERPEVDALVTWAAVSHFDRWHPETVATWRELGRVHVLNSRTGQQMPLDVSLLEDFEENRERLDVRRAARSLDQRWLIVHGTGDDTVPSADARALAEEAPHARLLLVEDAGHTLDVGHPFQGPSPAYSEAVRATIEHLEALRD